MLYSVLSTNITLNKKAFIMITYDYVELKEETFNHLVSDSKPYKITKHPIADKYFYNCFGATVIKVIDKNITQFFINSANPA